MLSKKMTVSLMSLITIFALVFVVTPAMADEFAVDMSIHPDDDISSKDNAQADPNKTVRVRIKFGQIVETGTDAEDFDLAKDMQIFAHDKYGQPKAAPALSGLTSFGPGDGRNYQFTVAIPTAGTHKVILYMDEHVVEAANPRFEVGTDKRKSKAAAYEITYLSDFDHGAPRVYEIRRASPHERPPVLKEKADAFQVVITLSEEPKEFKKDHIDASNATAGDPIPLIPIDADNTLSKFGEGLTGAPKALSLYTAGTPSVTGLHAFLNADSTTDLAAVTGYADLSADLQNAAKAYITARAAYETQRNAGPNSTAYFPEIVDDNIPAVETDDSAADKALLPRKLPDSKLTIGTGNDQINLTTIVTADGKIDVSKAPTVPAQDLPQAARNDFGLLNDAHMEYTKAKAAMTAYDNAVKQAAKDFAAAVQMYLDENTGTIAQLKESKPSTGTDGKLHRYYVVITPKFENTNPVVVKVKAFEDLSVPAMKYSPPLVDRAYTEGFDKLTVQIGREVKTPGVAAHQVKLNKEHFIPKDGYLVVVDDKAGSAIIDPGGAKDAPPVTRSPAGLKYNLHAIALPNLYTFLLNGGVIDVVSPMDLTITEIMWGTDASLTDDNTKSQWIELHNSGAGANTGDKDTILNFYGYGQAPPLNADGTLPTGVKDRVGTIDAKNIIWSIVNKGQNGRTGTGEEASQLLALAPKQELISMYRITDTTTGKLADGTMAGSWLASTGPAQNFNVGATGVRIGSPGAKQLVTAAEIAAAKAAADAKAAAAKAAADAAAKQTEATGTVPTSGQIYISEIMFAGDGRLPQWIEIANGSRTEEINLSGWTITVDNAVADADVTISTIELALPSGTKIAPFGQNDNPSTVLVVTTAGRTNVDDGPGTKGADQIVNLWNSNQDDLILADVTSRRYTLLSDMAFMITLEPPAPKKTTVAATATVTEQAAAKAADALAMRKHRAATDMVGNLGADGAAAWALPMSEGARSSIIRRHIPVSVGPAEPEDGRMEDSWALASDTSFAQATHLRVSSYYGAASDSGSPGFRAGGALPVELSHFRPDRNKETGQVVITWSTQSELNNAGFFIKRSQQKDGEFKVINATMIAGAGTTSEKQFYTYTDTTAQPNVVYYYQIEDVSLDGQRQTLTRGIRLKGHVGAAGKATLTWGELKTSNE